MMSLSFNLSIPMVRETSGEECRTPKDVMQHVAPIAQAAQECFVVMTLDTKYRIIDRHLVGIGILDACLVQPREIFRNAIMDNAAAVCLCHNHPSGDSTPSAADIKITRQMVQAGQIIGIEVLDHVVVGRPSPRNADGFTSLRESGMVSFAA